MAESTEIYPSLPSNYITIVDLQKQWMMKQQQQQKQTEEEEDEEKTRKEKEELNRNLSNKSGENAVTKRESPFQKLERSKYDSIANPNFKNRKPIRRNFDRRKPLEKFQGVEKATEINEVATATVKDEKKKKNLGKIEMNGDYQTAEIESKLEEVAIEEPKKVYGSYRRVEHQRGFGGKNWGFRREKENPTPAIEERGRVSKVDRISESGGGWRNGRSMAAMGGHRRAYNYMVGGNKITGVWVKKSEFKS